MSRCRISRASALPSLLPATDVVVSPALNCTNRMCEILLLSSAAQTKNSDSSSHETLKEFPCDRAASLWKWHLEPHILL
jgi:hypothetical protein